MSDGYFAARVIGTVIDERMYEKFCKNLGDISPNDAIHWFVQQIATEQMHIERMEETDADGV